MRSQDLVDGTSVEFDATWIGFGGVHGGLLTAMLMRAASSIFGGQPHAVSAHMYGPVAPGPSHIDVVEHRRGRSAGVQAGIADRVTALVRLDRDVPTPRRAPQRTVDAAADPLSLPRFQLPADLVPFAQHVDIRPIDDARPLAGGDEPGYDVWIRLIGESTAALRLTAAEEAVVLLDALAPGLFAIRTEPILVPTIEYTVHLAPFQATEWYHLRHSTAWATDALCVDESELFTQRGELAAQARQLRRIHAPAATAEQ